MKNIIEKFRLSMNEQEDKFLVPSELTAIEVASLILDKIKEVSTLPEDARYKSGIFKINLTNFGSVPNRDQVIKDLDNAGYILSKGEPYRFGLYTSAVTKYYKMTRRGSKKYISIILYHGRSGTMSAFGSTAEEKTAKGINLFLKNNGLEDRHSAIATGGSGHGNDVEVRNPITGEMTHSFEIKRGTGSRVDFGQFKMNYDPKKGWQMATGKENEVFRAIFSEIKAEVNEKVNPTEGPYSSSFRRPSAKKFWSQHEPSRERSLSGDIMKFYIPKNLIQEYYRQKGNDFIILGNDIYSLNNNLLPRLEEVLTESFAVFRIKDHSRGSFSYTVAMRGRFRNLKETDFARALTKIFVSE